MQSVRGARSDMWHHSWLIPEANSYLNWCLEPPVQDKNGLVMFKCLSSLYEPHHSIVIGICLIIIHK